MKIAAVKYDWEYQLRIEFDDGKLIDADFHDFLFSAKNSMTRQFLNKKLFKRVMIVAGSLSWINQMDIHYLDLYYDRIPAIKIREIDQKI